MENIEKYRSTDTIYHYDIIDNIWWSEIILVFFYPLLCWHKVISNNES
jgi:hypothetical protein